MRRRVARERRRGRNPDSATGNSPGPRCTFVKLQRPPPEMRIFSPTTWIVLDRAARGVRAGRACAAHIMPAAPAPMTTTSKRAFGRARRPSARDRRALQHGLDAQFDLGPRRRSREIRVVGFELAIERVERVEQLGSSVAGAVGQPIARRRRRPVRRGSGRDMADGCRARLRPGECRAAFAAARRAASARAPSDGT